MKSEPARPGLEFWKGGLFFLIAAGLGVTVFRYAAGLGAVTGMSDVHPWGLWKGFNVLCGAGLAGGGFLVAAGICIFHLDRFRPIVRSAVLGACLAQLFLLASLLIDLGRPWTIWHPLFMWNPESVAFELAWSVVLFTVVVGLVFSRTVFARLGWKRATSFFDIALVPLAIIGVVLAAVLQTLLGVLFLIVPEKLHAFWYSDWLPLLFFVSSICAGLALVVVLSHLASNVVRRVLPETLLRDVGRFLVPVLVFYGVLRLVDLWSRGALVESLRSSYEARMFQIEFLLGVLLPAVLLAIPGVRRVHFGRYAASQLVILGFIINRLNVTITGFEAARGGYYLPALFEILITLMLVGAAMAVFGVAVRTLDIYPDWTGPEAGPVAGVEPTSGPRGDDRHGIHLVRVR